MDTPAPQHEAGFRFPEKTGGVHVLICTDSSIMGGLYDTRIHRLCVDPIVVSSGVYWCFMTDDEKNWTRLTLRLPPHLHQRLVNNASGRSLNTTIIKLLEGGLESAETVPKSYQDMRAAIMAEVDQHMEERFSEWLEQIEADKTGDMQRENAEQDERS